MTRNKSLLGLTLVFVFAALFATLRHDYERQTAHHESGEISKLTFKFRNVSTTLVRASNRWEVDSINGIPSRDRRANEDLVQHFIDLFAAMKKAENRTLNARDAMEYGLNSPHLEAELSWQLPEPGQERIQFGRRNLNGSTVFALFPDKGLFAEVPSNVTRLFEHISALDLRNRKITTFDSDDVEELKVHGHCGQFSLIRDGDQWLWQGATGRRGRLNENDTDQWLDRLLDVAYTEVIDDSSTHSLEGFCRIELHGRRQRHETITVAKAEERLEIRNSALPARYFVSKEFLRALSR